MFPQNLFPVWLCAIALFVFSCEKSLDEPVVKAGLMPSIENATTGSESVALDSDKHCVFLPCKDAIEEVRLTYQQLANDLCDTVWMDITCCQDEITTYALVFVAPNSIKCRTEAAEHLSR